MPTGDPWQKSDRDVSPAEHRYLMTVIATAANPRFNVSRVDIDRDGPTYTIDTLRDLQRGDARRRALLHHRRRRAGRHLHLARRRRALRARPLRRLHPPGLRDGPGDAGQDPLRPVTMVEIPALAISSTDCRERKRRGEPVWYLVPDGVVQYIAKHDLYASQTSTGLLHDRHRPRRRARRRRRRGRLRQAGPDRSSPSTSASSSPSPTRSSSPPRPTTARSRPIVDEVEDKLRETGAKPIRREGHREGRWVLLDYGEIVVHVQHEEERQFYALERLWRDCPVIPLPADVEPAPHPAWPAAARPDRLERRGPGPGARRRRARRRRARPGRRPSRPVLAALSPGRGCGPQRPRARPPDRRSVARGDRARRRGRDPRLREYDVGERTGLTIAEFAAAFPEEYAAWLAGDESPTVPGAETTADVLGPHPPGPARRCSPPWGRGRPASSWPTARPAGRGRRPPRLAGRDGRDPRRDGQLRLAPAARAHAVRSPPAGVVQRAGGTVSDRAREVDVARAVSWPG